MAKPINKKAAAPAKKNVPAVVKRTSQEVSAAAKDRNVPAELEELMKDGAGRGVSKDQADNLVPIIVILQKGSPQVERGNTKFIEGAEASNIWLKNFDEPFIPSNEDAEEDGMIFQPCYFDKDFVEWIPRDNGGGFVARHRIIPQEAKKIVDPKNKNKVKWVLPNGNEIVETRYHVGRVFLEDGRRLPYVIPLASSGHTVSRNWMTMMNNVMTNSGKTADSFAKCYQLRTKLRTNTVGQTWFQFTVVDHGWVSAEDYHAGFALNVAFEKDEKDIDTRGMGDAQDTKAASDGAM